MCGEYKPLQAAVIVCCYSITLEEVNCWGLLHLYLESFCKPQHGSDLHGCFEGHYCEATVRASLARSCLPIHATAEVTGLESTEHVFRMTFEKSAQYV